MNRCNFSEVFHSAWMDGMSMKNVIASFQATGIYPPARDVVLSRLLFTFFKALDALGFGKRVF